ncbi:hypothetical protein BGW42_007125 [Actinomortierella wolfii]|nr:hypothetical protein BGW42_007125 [Actinomortierella wolfii]
METPISTAIDQQMVLTASTAMHCKSDPPTLKHTSNYLAPPASHVPNLPESNVNKDAAHQKEDSLRSCSPISVPSPIPHHSHIPHTSSKGQRHHGSEAIGLLLANTNTSNNSGSTNAPRVCKILEKHPLVKIEWRVPETIKAAGETLRGVVIVSVKDSVGSHPVAQPSSFLAGVHSVGPPAVVEQLALELIGIEVATGETSTITNPHDQSAAHSNSGVRFVVPKTNSVLGTAVIRPYSLWGFGSSASSSSSSGWSPTSSRPRHHYSSSSSSSASSRQSRSMPRSSSESASLVSSNGRSSGGSRQRSSSNDFDGSSSRRRGYGSHHRHGSYMRSHEPQFHQHHDSDYEAEQRYRQMERLKREREVEEVGFGAHIDKSIVAAGESITLDMFVVKSDLLKVVDIKVSLVETISIFAPPPPSPTTPDSTAAVNQKSMGQRGKSKPEQDYMTSCCASGCAASGNQQTPIPKRLLESHVVKIAKDYVPAQSEESIKNDKHMKGYYEDFEDTRTSKSLSTYRITMKIPESALTIKDRELINVKYVFVIKYFFKRRVGAFLEIPVEILSQYNHNRVSAISGAMSCISEAVQIALPPIPAAVPASLISPKVVMDLYPHKEECEQAALQLLQRNQAHMEAVVVKSPTKEPSSNAVAQDNNSINNERLQVQTHPQSPKKRPPSPGIQGDTESISKKSPRALRSDPSLWSPKYTQPNYDQQQEESTIGTNGVNVANKVYITVDSPSSPLVRQSSTGGSRYNLPAPINTSLLRMHGSQGATICQGTTNTTLLSGNSAEGSGRRSGNSDATFTTACCVTPSPIVDVPLSSSDEAAQHVSSGRSSTEYSALESPIPSNQQSPIEEPQTPSKDDLKKPSIAVTETPTTSSHPKDLDPRRLFASPASIIETSHFDDAASSAAAEAVAAYAEAEARMITESHEVAAELVSQEILATAKLTNAETISCFKTNPVEVVVQNPPSVAPPQQAVIVEEGQQNKQHCEPAALSTPKIVVDDPQSQSQGRNHCLPQVTTPTTLQATNNTPTMAEILPFSLTSAVPRTPLTCVTEGTLPVMCGPSSSPRSTLPTNTSSPSSNLTPKNCSAEPAVASTASSSPRMGRGIGLLGSFLKPSPTASVSSLSSNLSSSSSSSTLSSIFGAAISPSSTALPPPPAISNSLSASPKSLTSPSIASGPVIITGSGSGGSGITSALAASTLPTFTLLSAVASAVTVPTPVQVKDGGVKKVTMVVTQPPTVHHHHQYPHQQPKVLVSCLKKSSGRQDQGSGSHGSTYPSSRLSPTTATPTAGVRKRVTFAKGSTPQPSPTTSRILPALPPPAATSASSDYESHNSNGSLRASNSLRLHSPKPDYFTSEQRFAASSVSSVTTCGQTSGSDGGYGYGTCHASSPNDSQHQHHQCQIAQHQPASPNTQRKILAIDGRIIMNNNKDKAAFPQAADQSADRYSSSTGASAGERSGNGEYSEGEEGSSEEEYGEGHDDVDDAEEEDDEYEDDVDDDDEDDEDDDEEEQVQETEEERLERRRIARVAWMAKYGDALQQVYGAAAQQAAR